MEDLQIDDHLYIYCDEYGRIKYQDYQKVFYVQSDSKVRVVLPPGALECHEATLIMNLPFEKDGETFYTMTEPLVTNSQDQFGRKEAVSKYGNEYDDYIIEFLPDSNMIGTQTYDVVLRYPGVFFFQFKYDDNNYTDPQWIQVDPDLKSGEEKLNVNSLRILTVLSR